jgi:hypothetical protein
MGTLLFPHAQMPAVFDSVNLVPQHLYRIDRVFFFGAFEQCTQANCPWDRTLTCTAWPNEHGAMWGPTSRLCAGRRL